MVQSILDPAQPQEKVQKGGSQFADVSQYLTQNAQQGKRLASDVGQSIVGAGNQARTSSQGVQQGFNQAVNASTVPYNEAIAQRAQKDPRSFYGYQDPVAPQQKAKGRQAPQRGGKRDQRQILAPTEPVNAPQGNFSNIVNYLSNQNAPVAQLSALDTAVAPTEPVNPDVAAFQAMRDANYTGPMDLTGQDQYAQALTDEQKAAQLTGGVGTDAGRADLLNAMNKGGSNLLDQMLLGTGGAQGILGGAAAQNADVSGGLSRANEAAAGRAASARDTTNATRQKIQENMLGDTGAFRTLQGNWNKKVPGREKNQYRQTNEQTLDALNRLMGTQYNAGMA